ncbi:hypothetical protein BJY52DRAFT_356708 [Lactarius psammicola]|nr:hypothetical protein BJY52DRAFT_356708 [Lactarius psammicola]
MQSRASSILAVLTYLFLLSASDLVVAQISVPSCIPSIWEWSYNSIGQDPCTILAYLMATCYNGEFSLDPIPGSTWAYLGPSILQSANKCECSTVAFNLFSACSTCQGGTSDPWTFYSENCTVSVKPSTFPNKVPPQTRVPQWVLQDPTIENLWDASEAFTIGDSPEILPGENDWPFRKRVEHGRHRRWRRRWRRSHSCYCRPRIHFSAKATARAGTGAERRRRRSLPHPRSTTRRLRHRGPT